MDNDKITYRGQNVTITHHAQPDTYTLTCARCGATEQFDGIRGLPEDMTERYEDELENRLEHHELEECRGGQAQSDKPGGEQQ